MAYSPGWGNASFFNPIPLVPIGTGSGWNRRRKGLARALGSKGYAEYRYFMAQVRAGRIAPGMGLRNGIVALLAALGYAVVAPRPGTTEFDELLDDLAEFLRQERARTDRERRERMFRPGGPMVPGPIPFPAPRPDPYEYTDSPPFAPVPTDRDEEEAVAAWMERRYGRRSVARYLRRH